MDISSLPAVPDAALPAAVRAGSDADKDSYKAALGFEKIMLGELVKAMTRGAPSDSSPPTLRGDAVHDAMTDALADAGGIGLAQQLFTTLRKVTP